MEKLLVRRTRRDLSIKTVCLKISLVFFFLSVIANNVFGENVNYYIISKACIFAFMAIALVSLLVGARFFASVPLVFILLNFYWILITTIWAPSRANGMQMLSTMAQTFIMAILIYEIMANTREFELYFKALYYSGIVLLVYSLYMYGFDGMIEQMREGVRIGGEIANQNTFGLVFSYACVCGVYFTVFKRRPLYLVGCAAFVFFALSSGSKKSVFTIVLGILLVLLFKYGIKRMYKVIIVGGVLVVGLYFLLSLPIFGVMSDRLFSFLSGEKNESDIIRSSMIRDGMRFFLEKPVFGYGSDAFRTISAHGTYSHNNFVELLVDYGIVGFLLYYAMFVYLAIKFFAGKGRGKPSNIMMAIILITRLVMDYGMVSFSSKGTWMLLAVAFAMALNENRLKRGLKYD